MPGAMPRGEQSPPRSVSPKRTPVLATWMWVHGERRWERGCADTTPQQPSERAPLVASPGRSPSALRLVLDDAAPHGMLSPAPSGRLPRVSASPARSGPGGPGAAPRGIQPSAGHQHGPERMTAERRKQCKETHKGFREWLESSECGAAGVGPPAAPAGQGGVPAICEPCSRTPRGSLLIWPRSRRGPSTTTSYVPRLRACSHSGPASARRGASRVSPAPAPPPPLPRGRWRAPRADRRQAAKTATGPRWT